MLTFVEQSIYFSLIYTALLIQLNTSFQLGVFKIQKHSKPSDPAYLGASNARKTFHKGNCLNINVQMIALKIMVLNAPISFGSH